MTQIGKLYSFYLKKIFKKSWLRITLISLFVLGIVWFAIPWLASYGTKDWAKVNLKESLNDPNSQLTTEEKAEIQRIVNELEGKESFRAINRLFFGKTWNNYTFIKNRQKIEEKLKEFEEKTKAGASDEELKAISEEIKNRKMWDSLKFYGTVDTTIFNADNSAFFNKTGDYNEKKGFWKLLNNISLWNLGGFFVSMFLTYNILRKAFLDSKKDGEEVMILTFTPGVKRSELFFSKVLAFLTFYVIINVITFLLPYGFYYFWAGPEQKAFGAFSLLGLYTTVIGPLLYFGLFLVPYLFISKFGFVASIYSYLLTFISTIWYFVKVFFPTSFWPYKLESYFTDPTIFTTISLVVGIVFIYLYYWNYQEEDLAN